MAYDHLFKDCRTGEKCAVAPDDLITNSQTCRDQMKLAANSSLTDGVMCSIQVENNCAYPLVLIAAAQTQLMQPFTTAYVLLMMINARLDCIQIEFDAV